MDNHNPDLDNESDDEGEVDLEDILSLDSLGADDASSVARDITVAWIQNNKYEDNLTEEEVATFYKTMYQAARFPTLWDTEDDEEDEIEGNGSLGGDDE